jgi:predicted patatin/cPLA2 family phospholipase
MSVMHPVAAALRDKPSGARIALVVEGGGMRGSVSGGMVLALEELGLRGAFDAVYGSSAGTLNAMWFASGRVRDGIPTWTDPALVNALIRRRRVLAGRPMVDLTGLVERRYEQLSPGLFRAVLESPVELHPIATDISTGHAADLHDHIADERSVRLAIRASAHLPLLAGPPVPLNGRRFVDAGLAAAIPFQIAIDQGATHVLVLRSRREGELTKPTTGRSAAAVARALRRVDPAVARAYLSRAEREAADEATLARICADPDHRPHVMSIRPFPGSPVPSRLTRDAALVGEALEQGRRALHAALGGPLSGPRAG